jgi:hypothetical protein
MLEEDFCLIRKIPLKARTVASDIRAKPITLTSYEVRHYRSASGNRGFLFRFRGAKKMETQAQAVFALIGDHLFREDVDGELRRCGVDAVYFSSAVELFAGLDSVAKVRKILVGQHPWASLGRTDDLEKLLEQFGWPENQAADPGHVLSTVTALRSRGFAGTQLVVLVRERGEWAEELSALGVPLSQVIAPFDEELESFERKLRQAVLASN